MSILLVLRVLSYNQDYKIECCFLAIFHKRSNHQVLSRLVEYTPSASKFYKNEWPCYPYQYAGPIVTNGVGVQGILRMAFTDPHTR